MVEAVYALIDKIKIHKDKQRIYLLIDGDIRLDASLPLTSIIRGDSKSKSIACASILAKVTRDRIMSLYHYSYPEYRFLEHKGYPTKNHKLALKRFGPSLIHRMSFCLV
jgi:ribonuclease HII